MLNRIRNRALELIKPIHRSLRRRKLRPFLADCSHSGEETLLDVGGSLGVDGEFESLYRSFRSVAVLNLNDPGTKFPGDLSAYRVTGDGCGLPFPPASFDWVFSNAVIEHVGAWERQKQFAAEIRRVARIGYFVATPNKSFPIEPHTLLPFYQFLSEPWQRRYLSLSPGYLREYESICLLTARQMRELFPDAQVTDAGFPVLGNSLVAYRNGSKG